jgi:hypothetical protein
LRYNLRDLRIFPIVVLALFLLLIVINLRTRNRLSGAPLTRGAGKAPSALRFDEFSPAIFDLQDGKAVSDSVFLITSNEKSEEVMARVRYRTRKDEDQLLIFSWYLGDTLKERDSVWAQAADTACRSVISIPRSDAGHWSVDIALKDNILLSTLCFELVVQNSAQHFRSLKGAGAI